MDTPTDFDIEIMIRTIAGEARNQPPIGQQAVAHVILNRYAAAASHGTGQRWGSTIAEICLKRRQFSCWNDDDPNRDLIARIHPDNPVYKQARAAMLEAYRNLLTDPTLGADHYHHVSITPYWASKIQKTTLIGAHLFYREIRGNPPHEPHS